MKKCLICEGKLSFIKFKCRDGHVCKNCYETVSQGFTQVIKDKTKEELLAQISEGDKGLGQTSSHFMISRKINQYILFDDQSKQLCLPNHPKFTKEKRPLEYFDYADVLNCQLQQIETLKTINKKELSCGRLCVEIRLKQGTRKIWLIPNPIDTSSMAYRTMGTLAEKIVTEIQGVQEGIPC